MTKVAHRDRSRTRTRLLDAAERVVLRDGPAAAGVNAIAKEAGVDKVLIYRYFGGARELLAALAAERGAWPDSDAAPAGASARATLQSALLATARTLRERPLARRALAWELGEHAPLARPVAETREAQWSALGETVPRPRHSALLDVDALAALLAGGLTYFALRADAPGRCFGLDASDARDWARVEKTVSVVLRALLEPSDA